MSLEPAHLKGFAQAMVGTVHVKTAANAGTDNREKR
jgi:hypothetical protein